MDENSNDGGKDATPRDASAKALLDATRDARSTTAVRAVRSTRANVGVRLEGVGGGVERRRGRGLNARDGRRGTPGEVLKERRSRLANAVAWGPVRGERARGDARQHAARDDAVERERRRRVGGRGGRRERVVSLLRSRLHDDARRGVTGGARGGAGVGVVASWLGETSGQTKRRDATRRSRELTFCCSTDVLSRPRDVAAARTTGLGRHNRHRRAALASRAPTASMAPRDKVKNPAYQLVDKVRARRVRSLALAPSSRPRVDRRR